MGPLVSIDGLGVLMAIPTGRDDSGWIPKEWKFHCHAVADKLDRAGLSCR